MFAVIFSVIEFTKESKLQVIASILIFNHDNLIWAFYSEISPRYLLSTEKKSRIDESDRGLCYFCGTPANIKVGLWSSLESITESDMQNWREVLICKRCNETHRWVDEQGLPDTFVGY